MKSLKKECYALLQEVVVRRDVFCRAPGCSNLATAGHHIFGRKNLATAFDPRYSIGMCVECHLWAHTEPEQFFEWVVRWMGEEYYTALKFSNTVVKHQDLTQIKEQLKAELRKYKS